MPDMILIDPVHEFPNSRPQLGTLQMAAMLLQGGHTVELVDLTVEEDGCTRLDTLLDGEVGCVGISSVIGPMLNGALAAARHVRDRRPDLPIVWGGIHPSTEPRSTLAHELVDVVFIGEGEPRICALVKALKDGGSPATVPGVGFKEGGKQIFTEPPTGYFDLDSLPPLPYHLVDLSRYRHAPDQTNQPMFFGLENEFLLSLETTRGCAYQCNYCVNAARKWAFRKSSPERVLERIDEIVALGCRGITINDDNFFIDRERANTILDELVRRDQGLEIFAAIRADYICKSSEAELRTMREAGIRMFGIGVESGSERVLRSINKRARLDQTFTASERLAEVGIYAWYHFIYGFPGEQVEDIALTHAAMKRIVSSNPYAQVNLNRLIPNPGTPSFHACVAAGWQPPQTIEQWARVIEETRSQRPAYITPEVERFWARHPAIYTYPCGEMGSPLVARTKKRTAATLSRLAGSAAGARMVSGLKSVPLTNRALTKVKSLLS